MNDPELQGLYSPSTGKVGCVLLAAAFLSDTRVCRIFDTSDWFLAPVDDMMIVTAPASQWEHIAGLPREARPGPEHFVRLCPETVDTAVESG